MLKWEDYDAEIIGTARNGTQALEFIDHQMPDLVITDIKMPVTILRRSISACKKSWGLTCRISPSLCATVSCWISTPSKCPTKS